MHTDLTSAEVAWLSLLRHELRTPLAGLLALARELDAAPMAPGQRPLLEALTDCATHMDGLIDRLVPQPRAGAPDAGTFEPFDAHRCLERLLMAHWPRAQGNGIGLCLCIGPGVPRLWLTGAGRLREVLDNLVVNAIDATRAGHVMVRVSPAGPLGGRFAVSVEVEDTGRGVDVHLARRMFRWGTRGGSSPGGSGIGLYVCRWLVGALGGQITHAPRPDGGSVFRVTLPVAEGDRPLPAARLSPSAFRSLHCAVALNEPAGETALSVLRRIGARARRVREPDWDRVAAGREAAVCDPRITPLPACDAPDHPGKRMLVIGSRLQERSPGLRGLTLPEPVLRCTWEPVLLEAALGSV